MNQQPSFAVLAISVFTALLTLSACSSPQKPKQSVQLPAPPATQAATAGTKTATAITQKPNPKPTTQPKAMTKVEPTTSSATKAVTEPATKPITKTITKTAAKNTPKATPNIKTITKPKPLTKPKAASKQQANPQENTNIAAQSEPTKKPTPPSHHASLPSPAKETKLSLPPSIPEVSLETLPVQIGPWTLDRSPSTTHQCTLVSATANMPDGQGSTPIYLEVTPQNATFYTKSNIDVSYSGTGIFIDQQSVIPIEQLYTPTSMRISTQYASLITAMKKHPSLEIKLGFWPSWPITQTYGTTLAIDNFELAYNALQKCNATF